MQYFINTLHCIALRGAPTCTPNERQLRTAQEGIAGWHDLPTVRSTTWWDFCFHLFSICLFASWMCLLAVRGSGAYGAGAETAAKGCITMSSTYNQHIQAHTCSLPLPASLRQAYNCIAFIGTSDLEVEPGDNQGCTSIRIYESFCLKSHRQVGPPSAEPANSLDSH